MILNDGDAFRDHVSQFLNIIKVNYYWTKFDTQDSEKNSK